jgi:hyperosmotically inducible protein
MRPAFSFLLHAAALVLVVLLSACAATTSRTADDATVSTQVKIALLNDSQLGILRLDARTFHGVVTLSGTVRSQAEADRAVAAAKKMPGVRGVTSELKIQPQ